MTKPEANRRLAALERRVDRASALAGELGRAHAKLREENARLSRKVEELNTTKMELTRQVNDLKMLHSKQAESFDKEEVRRKIDRMLERFNELQM